MRYYKSILIAATLLFTSGINAALVDINPIETFLLTNNDNVDGTPPILLADHGIVAGDKIDLEIFGGWNFGANGNIDFTSNTVAVFSSTSDLLSSNNLNRVTGALDAGADVISHQTFFAGLSTDITQDFFLSSGAALSIVVPDNALYLFVAAHDSLYNDNSDLNNNYKINLSINSVPVPAAFWLLGSGLIFLVGLSKIKLGF